MYTYLISMFPEAVDMTSFRQCHSEACLRLGNLCDTWEKKLIELYLPDISKEEGW